MLGPSSRCLTLLNSVVQLLEQPQHQGLPSGAVTEEQCSLLSGVMCHISVEHCVTLTPCMRDVPACGAHPVRAALLPARSTCGPVAAAAVQSHWANALGCDSKYALPVHTVCLWGWGGGERGGVPAVTRVPQSPRVPPECVQKGQPGPLNLC